MKLHPAFALPLMVIPNEVMARSPDPRAHGNAGILFGLIALLIAAGAFLNFREGKVGTGLWYTVGTVVLAAIGFALA